MTTSYFRDSVTGLVLRRGPDGDQRWDAMSRTWRPTTLIANHLMGQDDDIEEVTTVQVANCAPGALEAL